MLALTPLGMSAPSLSTPSPATADAGGCAGMPDALRIVFAGDLIDVQAAPGAPDESGFRREDCATWLPMQAPVEVQSESGTIKHLYTEPDRISFLSDHKAGALWVELLDLLAPVDGCPNGVEGMALVDALEQRMECLGIGAMEGMQTSGGNLGDGTNGEGECVDAPPFSEFETAEALSIPSIYMRCDGYQPGTMAALEYDLGWWAMAPKRNRLTPLDEETWCSDPNPGLYRMAGRDIIRRLPIEPSKLITASGVARILSLHSHAAGFANCLTNVTRVAARKSAHGVPIPAIEASVFERACTGDWWRSEKARGPERDALTQHRKECDARMATSTTPRTTGLP